MTIGNIYVVMTYNKVCKLYCIYIKLIIIKIFTVNNLQIYLDAMPFIGSKNVNLTTLNKKIPNSAKAVALLQVSNML